MLSMVNDRRPLLSTQPSTSKVEQNTGVRPGQVHQFMRPGHLIKSMSFVGSNAFNGL